MKQMDKKQKLNYIQEVVKSGKLNKKNEYGKSIAHIAMEEGEETLALEILKREDFDLSSIYRIGNNQYNLLYLAAQYACPTVVDYLLNSPNFSPLYKFWHLTIRRSNSRVAPPRVPNCFRRRV